MFKVTTAVQVINENLESAGRAGYVFANEQTHPMLDAEETAKNPDGLQVEPGTVAVLLDGDTEPLAFDVADIREL